MAYNFLGLVNEINRRLNEVELTADNFSTAKGFYAHAKDAINASLRYINQSEYGWPFNHVIQEDTLTAGITRYPFPDDCKIISFNTFRIKEDTTLGNATKKLNTVTYEEYLEKSVSQEYKTLTENNTLPDYVFQAPSLEYGLVPPPDLAYTVVYEYYRIPVDLEQATDVPAVPERFKHVIVDGSMHYAYLFRGDTQMATVALQKFEGGIKQMSSMLINRYDYLRSYMVSNNQGGGRLASSSSNAGSSLDSL
jgi:hypothetical protein